jgi:hypothetical protein
MYIPPFILFFEFSRISVSKHCKGVSAMTVVINDFEIEAAPSSKGLQAEAPAAPPAPQPPQPRDIERILRHLAARLARVAAS